MTENTIIQIVNDSHVSDINEHICIDDYKRIKFIIQNIKNKI